MNPDPNQTAINPTTPAETLEELAKNPTYAPKVAANPNTPLPLLLRLATTHPEAVAANPAFELGLASGQIDMHYLVQKKLLNPLIASGQAPEALLLLAAQWNLDNTKNQQLTNLILMDPRTPTRVVQQLESEAHSLNARYHVNNTPVDESNLDSLYAEAVQDIRSFEQPTDPTLQALAPLVSTQLVQHLVTSRSIEATTFAASSDHLTAEQLEELSRNPRNHAILYATLRNPNLPTARLVEAAESSDSNVVMAVAKNPNLPREQLNKLVGTLGLPVVYSNPQLPPETLRAAINTANLAQLVAIAENPSAPDDVLTTLAEHHSHVVRAAVARNPHTSRTLLSNLMFDPEPYVRQQRREAKRLEDIKSQFNNAETINTTFIDRPETQVVIADTLTHLPLTEPALHEVAQHLARQPHPVVRIVLAANPHTPTSTLKTLAADDADQRVRAIARQTLEVN